MASMMGSNYLPTEYQSFIHMSRYSRWLEDKGRRESWSETVSRLISYFKNQIDTNYKGVINIGTGKAIKLKTAKSTVIKNANFHIEINKVLKLYSEII